MFFLFSLWKLETLLKIHELFYAKFRKCLWFTFLRGRFSSCFLSVRDHRHQRKTSLAGWISNQTLRNRKTPLLKTNIAETFGVEDSRVSFWGPGLLAGESRGFSESFFFGGKCFQHSPRFKQFFRLGKYDQFLPDFMILQSPPGPLYSFECTQNDLTCQVKWWMKGEQWT